MEKRLFWNSFWVLVGMGFYLWCVPLIGSMYIIITTKLQFMINKDIREDAIQESYISSEFLINDGNDYE